MEEIKAKCYDDYIKIAEDKMFELYKDDMVRLVDSKNEIHSVAQTLVNIDLKNSIEELVNIIKNERKENVEAEKPVAKQPAPKTKK